MTHQLITEILLLSKEKTGLNHPIKERMKGNLLLLIHRGSSLKCFTPTFFFTFQLCFFNDVISNGRDLRDLYLNGLDLVPKMRRRGPVLITGLKQQG